MSCYRAAMENLSMNRLCIAVASFVVCCSTFAAAEQPGEEKPNSKWEPSVQIPAVPVMPKCDIKFVISNDPQPMPAAEDTLPVIGEKYFTRFEMVIPPDAFESRGNYSLNDNERRVRSLFQAFTMQLPADTIGRSVELLPSGVRPKGDIGAFFSPRFGIGGLQSLPGKNSNFLTYSVNVQLFTTSNGDPQVRVRSLCDIYTYEMSIPEQEEFIKQAKDHVAKAAKLHRYIEIRLAASESDKKQLASLSDFADITPASLETFRSQRRLLDVDGAGLKARVDACEKILKGGPASATATQVESVKVTAEIELAGLEAKRAEIDRIIQNGQERLDLRSKVDHEQEKLERLANDADIAVRDAETAVDCARQWAKCPIPGAVHTNPIKWEAPKSK